jgi:signal transduction histidine kinase
MYWSHAPQTVTEGPTATSAVDTRLRGIWLALARLAWAAMAGLALLLFVLGIPARYDHVRNLSGDDAIPTGWTPAAIRAALAQLGLSTDFRAIYFVALAVLVAVGASVVAVALLWRKSDDGLALFVSLFLLTLGVWPTGVLPALVVSHPEWWLPYQVMQAFVLIGFLYFCLLFPDGRFVPRWSRGVAFVWSLLVIGSVAPLATNLTPWLSPLLLAVGWSAAALAQVYRYRRVSGPVERQQTKWVVFGIAGVVLTLLVFVAFLPTLVPALYQPTALGVLFEMVAFGVGLFGAFLFLPLSVGIALLRYRLWDIDLVLSRTVVYGALTVGVLALSALLVGGLSALFQASGNGLITLLATGLVAALLFPLRTRMQRGVNRLIYGQRDEPLKVLARLGRRLEATLAADAVFPQLVETVTQALKLPYTAILLKEASEFSVVASSGQPPRDPVTLPIRYQGELLGQLRLAPRTPGEAFTTADLRLLDELARQAGVAAHAVELHAELQRARERLVLAREEERRRLRRDLHDGLGPQLASQTLTLSAAAKLLRADPAAAEELLAEALTHAQTAVTDIRRLVYGLRPPALDDLGLVGALADQAAQYSASGLRVTITAPDEFPPLPAAVEVACYRIAQEALTNVARHAQARSATLTLAVDAPGATLILEVVDNGCGLPTQVHAGVGLTSMRERAAELGGTCVVETASGGGVRIYARLPLSS